MRKAGLFCVAAIAALSITAENKTIIFYYTHSIGRIQAGAGLRTPIAALTATVDSVFSAAAIFA